MKRVLSFASVFSFALVVSLAGQATPAQAPAKIASDADYMAHMKEVGQLNGVLGKAIKGGMVDDAAKAAASRLEVLFKNVHAYWNDKKVEDATTAAASALTSLQAIQKAFAANDMTAAEAGRAALASQCMTCHTAHREKLPEGGWRIK
jgi:cytochrome c556